jgi:DNA-binding NarL/FixJ family response regulator
VGDVTVLTVDDKAIFRRVARSLIEATAGFEQVGEAASGAEALRLAPDLHPDLVLVDVRMRGMDGIETARHLAEVAPDAVVVLISMEEVPELRSLMAAVGAAAYVRKQDLSARKLREVWAAHAPHPG